MSPRTILVTGAGGMVGSYVPEIFAGETLLLTDIVEGFERLDVCDPTAVMKAMADATPDLVLHLAAATDVDRCEQEPELAYRTNAMGTQNVALACLAHDVPLVYISTAGVFAGDKPEPYIEFDSPNPANIYGRSKLAGEGMVASLLRRYYIVRAGWMVGGGDRDKKFVGKITRLIRDGHTQIQAVDDKWGSPTYAKDLLGGIRRLVDTGFYSLYHMVNQGCCSRYEVALVIRDALQRPDVQVAPVSSDRFPLPAPRARSEAMRNFKLELLGLDGMRPWQEAVRDYILTELAPAPSSARGA